MTPKELENSILKLAIQGKLVEQRLEEGTAEELYQQIQLERRVLINSGTIKNDKPLSELTEDKKPFDIPESWKWVHIYDIAVSKLGKALDKEKNTGDLQPYLCNINVYWSGINLCKVKKARFEKVELPKYKLEKGDLLICEGGNAGRSAIWNSDDIMYYQKALYRVRFFGGIDANFYKYLLQYYKGTGIIDSYSNGVTIKHLVQTSLNDMWLPLPPLAEQKRITAKIDELLPCVDQYEKAWSKLEEINNCFSTDMYKSILQMSIQGKLVEQRPEEGTGDELFQQIKFEKQKNIKASNVNKTEPILDIAEDEKPFDIPECWKWMHLSDILNTIATGPFGSLLHKSDYVNRGIPLVNPANIINGKIVRSEKMMVSIATKNRLESYILHSGMIVIGRRGEMGRCAVVTDSEDGWLCGTGSFFMEPSSLVFVDFIYTILSSPYARTYLSGESVGTTMSNLNHTILSKMPVPIPPLAEQKRIVSKLEEILRLCEQLK